jgi:type IV pilus assembly protein PilV
MKLNFMKLELKKQDLMNNISKIKNFELGVSLIEVLVSLFIFSIGMLGLAGLQGTALKTADSANLRATAAVLSHEILENMRANRTAALANNYDLDISAAAPPASADNCDTSSCTSTELAAYDLDNWWNKIIGGNNSASQFPGGDASISVANGVATITILWNDARADSFDSQDSIRVVTFTISAMI